MTKTLSLVLILGQGFFMPAQKYPFQHIIERFYVHLTSGGNSNLLG